MDFLTRLLARAESAFKLDLRYIIKGNFWLLAARVTAVGSGMILTVVFANVLTPTDFGFYKYVISVAGIVTAFSLTGIGTALINSIARGDVGTIRTTLRASFLWGLLASVVALGISAYYFYNGDTSLGIALIVVALATPLFASFGNYRQLFFGNKDFRANAIISTIRSIAPVALILLSLLITRDPLWIAISYFVSNSIVVVVLYFYTIWKYRVPKTAESTESTIRFARYTSVLAFFSQITSQADQLLVWHFVGPAGVAFYSFATSPIEQLQSVTGNVFSLVAPKFAVKEEAELRRTIPLRMVQMLIIVIPITFLYIALAPVFFGILFPKYVSVIWLTQLYALVLLLQPQGFVDAALVAREDTGSRNILIATGQIAKLIFLTAGIWKFGIPGGVGALVLSEVVNLILALIVLARIKNTPIKPL